MTDTNLRGKINTLIYEVTDSDDVVKQLADLLEPFCQEIAIEADQVGYKRGVESVFIAFHKQVGNEYDGLLAKVRELTQNPPQEES